VSQHLYHRVGTCSNSSTGHISSATKLWNGKPDLKSGAITFCSLAHATLPALKHRITSYRRGLCKMALIIFPYFPSTSVLEREELPQASGNPHKIHQIVFLSKTLASYFKAKNKIALNLNKAKSFST
jgi:hypothetical protein